MRDNWFTPRFPNIVLLFECFNSYIQNLIDMKLPLDIVHKIAVMSRDSLVSQLADDIRVDETIISECLSFDIKMAKNRYVTFECIRALLNLEFTPSMLVVVPAHRDLKAEVCDLDIEHLDYDLFNIYDLCNLYTALFDDGINQKTERAYHFYSGGILKVVHK